jgi:ZIP family zinc transporter
VAAITLHNLPEGLAVGVGFAAGEYSNGLTLAIGIGIQNIPEGLAVALALRKAGYSRGRSFLVGASSGLAEPLGGALGAGIVSVAAPFLPFGLAFAAGAMLFVISQEVIPEMHRESVRSINSFGLLIGFVIMMLLDVVFG